MHPLERDTTRGAQIGCAVVAALVVGVMSAGFFSKVVGQPRGDGSWILWTMGGGFALIALILVYAAIHQVFSLRNPITEISLDRLQLQRGQRAAVLIRQRGPMELESLRANLVGTRIVRRNKSLHSEPLDTFPFFDSGPVIIDEIVPMIRSAHIDVPDDIEPSGAQVTWKIEVCGKVRGRADFQHAYVVEVV